MSVLSLISMYKMPQHPFARFILAGLCQPILSGLYWRYFENSRLMFDIYYLAVVCKFTSVKIPKTSLTLLGISSNNLIASVTPTTLPLSSFPIKMPPQLVLAKPHIHFRYSSLQGYFKFNVLRF